MFGPFERYQCLLLFEGQNTNSVQKDQCAETVGKAIGLSCQTDGLLATNTSTANPMAETTSSERSQQSKPGMKCTRNHCVLLLGVNC